MRFCIESCTLPAPWRPAGMGMYTVARRPRALEIRWLPLDVSPDTAHINQYIPYIAATPAARATARAGRFSKPALVAALPATPKNAAAATSVRNEMTPNNQLESGW